MSDTDNKPAEAASADFTRTGRYKLGLILIIVGNLIIVLSALVFPFIGVGAGTIGALVLGGEGLSLLSIVFLGKEGFKAIKSKIFGAVKAGYVGNVSRTRHQIGIFLFVISVLNNYIIAVYAWVVFGKTTPENPFPEVWGLSFQGQENLVFWVFLIFELAFLSSIYILGAEWWGRFRNIFVWKGEE